MKTKNIRFVVQISVLILITLLGILHQIAGGGPSGSPSVDALCAFGGLETLFSIIKDGTLIKRIELSSVVLLGALAISGIFFGRAFCGFICPFGTLQEIFNKLGKKIGIKKYELPKSIHKYLIYVKYAVLVLILYLTWTAGELIIRSYDPWAAFMHIGGGMEAVLESPWSFVILASILLAAIFIDRFFCKYLCPLGAFMALFNKISIFKIKRKPSCISCGICSKTCPMNIDVKDEGTINSTECIMCTECISACPVNNALQVENNGKIKKSMGPKAIILTVALMFVLTIGTAKVIGIFETSSPANIVLENNQTGKMDPANIKGYMTLNEISKNFNIPLNRLYSELKLPAEISPDIPLKAIASKLPAGNDFGPDSAREVIKKILE